MTSPVKERKQKIEFKSQTRDFVFGIQDGLISILGLITGVYGAYSNQPRVVVITGITGAIAAALSMAAGSLLSAEAERDILLAEIEKAREDFQNDPKIVEQSLHKELEKEGLDHETSEQVVNLLSKREDVMFENFRSMVLDLPGLEKQNPWKNATVMFFAFLLGALFPISPFLFTEGQPAFLTAIATTGIALFGVGALKGNIARENYLKSGAKFFVIAVSAGLLSELIGSTISILF